MDNSKFQYVISKFQYVVVDNEAILTSYSANKIRYRVLFNNHIHYIKIYPLIGVHSKYDIKKAKEIIKNNHKIHTTIKVIYAESYLN